MKCFALSILIVSLNAVGVTFDVTSDERSQFNQGRKLAVSTENGEKTGYKLIQVEPGSMFDRSGFEEQDVITHVNGLEVSNSSNIKEINRILYQSDEIEFRIKRESFEMPMFIRVKFNKL